MWFACICEWVCGGGAGEQHLRAEKSDSRGVSGFSHLCSYRTVKADGSTSVPVRRLLGKVGPAVVRRTAVGGLGKETRVGSRRTSLPSLALSCHEMTLLHSNLKPCLLPSDHHRPGT